MWLTAESFIHKYHGSEKQKYNVLICGCWVFLKNLPKLKHKLPQPGVRIGPEPDKVSDQKCLPKSKTSFSVYLIYYCENTVIMELLGTSGYKLHPLNLERPKPTALFCEPQGSCCNIYCIESVKTTTMCTAQAPFPPNGSVWFTSVRNTFHGSSCD